ncbi:MAG: OmpA family protein [Hyphomicrobiales bacterium]|jgi:peptidoglycan-associated lipoprotein|nr:OmpA family protein [Hyphomicrobiales bacterium]|tara:strand:- start:1881 stop:2390 length:510 start_codon:yes stop_codon:yes gene_type:complete
MVYKKVLNFSMTFLLIFILAGCGSRQKIEQVLFGGGTDNEADIISNAIPGSSQDFTVNVGDRVFFATNSSSLDGDAKAILERQASWLALYPDIEIIVEGHADERGTRDYNLALSAKRAQVSLSYLESLGIQADRIETMPYGKERPVAACASEACWSQNRRASSVVVTDQ